jgi:hypothetical protein
MIPDHLLRESKVRTKNNYLISLDLSTEEKWALRKLTQNEKKQKQNQSIGGAPFHPSLFTTKNPRPHSST